MLVFYAETIEFVCFAEGKSGSLAVALDPLIGTVDQVLIVGLCAPGQMVFAAS